MIIKSRIIISDSLLVKYGASNRVMNFTINEIQKQPYYYSNKRYYKVTINRFKNRYVETTIHRNIEVVPLKHNSILERVDIIDHPTTFSTIGSVRNDGYSIFGFKNTLH